jgi:hypothetical protein
VAETLGITCADLESRSWKELPTGKRKGSDAGLRRPRCGALSVMGHGCDGNAGVPKEEEALCSRLGHTVYSIEYPG